MPKLLEIHELNKSFSKSGQKIEAVRDFSCSLENGQCMGIVGESGSGKSTVAGLITGFIKPERGEIIYDNEKLLSSGRKAQLQRKTMQMIFQNPISSLNPHMTILANLKEAAVYYEKIDDKDFFAKASEELVHLGLSSEYLSRYPRELSGGECQRVAIAKALIRRPKLLICDEITSALDVCVQAEIIKYLIELKSSGISILFITHDLSITRQLCDRIIVMQNGRIVEQDTTSNILDAPKQQYTRLLVSSTFD